jgi:hypothetical protein
VAETRQTQGSPRLRNAAFGAQQFILVDIANIEHRPCLTDLFSFGVIKFANPCLFEELIRSVEDVIS